MDARGRQVQRTRHRLARTTEASSLPPRSIAARGVRSKSPFSFFPPRHGTPDAGQIPRTFKANRRSPSRSEATVSVVNPTKMAKNNRVDDIGVDRLLR